MKNFIVNLFSIFENKVSSLIVTFIPTLLIALYCVLTVKDIPLNLTNLLIAFIVAISGVNVIPNLISKKEEKEEEA